MSSPQHNILIYDINSFPHEIGLTVEDILKLYKEEHFVLYDGQKGNKPELLNVNELVVTFVDVSKQEELKKFNNYKTKMK